MLYTRKGDNGSSGLFGTQERFPKDSPIYEALGSLDELNSLLGFCRAQVGEKKQNEMYIANEIVQVQQCLFVIQAEIAGSPKTLSQVHVSNLEERIAAIEALIENPHAFVIPGATVLSGLFDFARAVSRRAERAVTAASAHRAPSAHTSAYLNRLSSFLYALARYTATAAGAKELSPHY
jgi:ATP:cob(I)alamin adenosyltransferase